MTTQQAAFGTLRQGSEQALARHFTSSPSERRDDIKKAAHDRAFIVAGAQKVDLLKDLHSAATKAIEQGTGYAQFHKDFMVIVKKHGWTSRTGEGTARRVG